MKKRVYNRKALLPLAWQRTGREKETKGKSYAGNDTVVYGLSTDRKKASKNTELSYQRDLRKLVFFLKEHGIEKPEQVNVTVLNSYLLYLEREQFSPATISRSIAAIHMFCQYACREGKMTSDRRKHCSHRKWNGKCRRFFPSQRWIFCSRPAKNRHAQRHPRQGNAGDALRDRHPCQ